MPRKLKPLLLTNLELAVMRVVWGADAQALTVREVTERLNEGRKKPLAYNTVQTMLTILKEKGAVRSRPGTGRAHLYVARRSRDEVSTSMIGDLVDRLFDGEVAPLFIHLMEDESVSRGELEALRSWIDSRLVDEEDSR